MAGEEWVRRIVVEDRNWIIDTGAHFNASFVYNPVAGTNWPELAPIWFLNRCLKF